MRHRCLISVTCIALSIITPSTSAQRADSGKPTSRQGQVFVPGLESMTIGGEYRLRFEELYNYDLDEKRADDLDFFTQRVRLHFDAEVNDRISAFIQIQDVRNWGEEVGPGFGTVDDSADGLDLKRAYVTWRDTCIGGTAKVGRQVLSFGDDRLIGSLEWTSQGRSFDGYRHTWVEPDSYTVDCFAMDIRERMPSAVYDDAAFGGVYATIDSLEDAELDVYLLLLIDEETAAGGTEKRGTVGLRFVRTVNGLEVGTEIAGQFGEIDRADIHIQDTYAAHVHGTYRFASGNKPWIRLEGNYATGNDPGTAGDNERFKNLFPTAHAHWGMMDFALWENLLHGMLQIGFEPAPNSRLAASFHVFESVEEADRFVGPAGRIAPAGTPAGSSNAMGHEFDLFYHVDFDTTPARTYLEAGYGFFLPGSGAKIAAGDDNPAHFFYLMSGLTF